MTLLAIIAGSLVRIDECRMFSVVSMREMVKATYKDTIWIMNNWPGGQHNEFDDDWINQRVVLWGDFLKDVKDHHTLPVFATMCSRCLFDLKAVVKNKQKLQLLDRLEAPLEKILQFIDPNLQNMPAFDKANLAMDYIYDLIEWEWK